MIFNNFLFQEQTWRLKKNQRNLLRMSRQEKPFTKKLWNFKQNTLVEAAPFRRIFFQIKFVSSLIVSSSMNIFNDQFIMLSTKIAILLIWGYSGQLLDASNPYVASDVCEQQAEACGVFSAS